METAAPNRGRVSPILLATIMATLLLSLVSIYFGITEYWTGDISKSSTYILLGSATLALSTYMLFQTRKRILRMGSKPRPMTTTLLCQKCSFRNIREFSSGDYIFKRTEDTCPKCSEKGFVVNAIYREVTEKEKTKEED